MTFIVLFQVNPFIINRSAVNGQDSAIILNQALMALNSIRYEMAHIIAILEFLTRVHKEYINLVRSEARILEANQVSESLAGLKEDCDGLVVYLRKIEDKAAIKFNLDITLQNERNSKINIEIARLTAQIAVDSKRDSSSMITYVDLRPLFTNDLSYISI